MTVSTNCRHCTVPVDTGDVCGWCSHYDGPEPDRYAPRSGQHGPGDCQTCIRSAGRRRSSDGRCGP